MILTSSTRFDVAFEPGLVSEIVTTMKGSRGGLPLMQFALDRLWQAQTDRRLTRSCYAEIGGVEGALNEHAEAFRSSLSSEDQAAVRRVMTRLVNLADPGTGSEDTRAVATRNQIGEEDWKLVGRLAKARLVTTGGAGGEAGTETAEIAHEALIPAWITLRAWLDEDRKFGLWRQRLRHDIDRWGGANDDALLRGALLAEAEGWRNSRREDLNDAELTYIDAGVSRREEAARKELLRTEHDGSVYDVLFSHDGTRLATGSNDNTARLVDVDARSRAMRGLDAATTYRNGLILSVGIALPQRARALSALAFDSSLRLADGDAIHVRIPAAMLKLREDQKQGEPFDTVFGDRLRTAVPSPGHPPGPAVQEAVMTALFSGLRARRAAHAEARIARIRAYLGANRTELAGVLGVAAGEHGAAQTAILAGLVSRPRPQIARIFALLEEMRDALVAADTETGDVASTARPDLDAAVRWHGARLDELLAAS